MRHEILESEYVREGVVYYLSARSREVYMRVSIAVCEVTEQTEKVRRTFSHVIADASGPREAVQCMSCPDADASCGLCSSAKGPPPEGPAARAGPSGVRRA